MNTDAYLAALDEKLHEMEGGIASTSIQREIDANLGLGFIKGLVTFVDGSRLDFSEQLPTERQVSLPLYGRTEQPHREVGLGAPSPRVEHIPFP